MKRIFYLMCLSLMCIFLNACTIGHGINKFEANLIDNTIDKLVDKLLIMK